MATKRSFECPTHPGGVPAPQLFESLLRCSQGKTPECTQCGNPMRLRLKFDFGLNASNSECTVAAAFTSREPQSWKDKDGYPVQFYPFLVFLERHGKGNAAWLPYWHIVDKPNHKFTKYGQWAPFMDHH